MHVVLQVCNQLQSCECFQGMLINTTTMSSNVVVVDHHRTAGCVLILWSYFPKLPFQLLRYFLWRLPLQVLFLVLKYCKACEDEGKQVVDYLHHLKLMLLFSGILGSVMDYVPLYSVRFRCFDFIGSNALQPQVNL